MKTRRVLAVGLALMVLLGAVVPASAAADPVISNFWIDRSGGTLNPCTDEWVEFTGSAHIIESAVTHESGDVTWAFHANERLIGVGMTTGAEYVMLSVANEHATVASDGAPFVYTFVTRSKDVTRGSLANFVYWQLWHITINANGTMTTEVVDSGWECRPE